MKCFIVIPIVLLSLIYFEFTSAQGNKCFKPKSVIKKLDLKKLEGLWYAIKIQVGDYFPVAICHTVSFKADSPLTFTATVNDFKCIRNKWERKVNSIYKATLFPNKSGTFKEFVSARNYTRLDHIVFIDYDRYALFYTCFEDETGPREDSFLISRSMILDDIVIFALETIARIKGVYRKMYKVDYTYCRNTTDVTQVTLPSMVC